MIPRPSPRDGFIPLLPSKVNLNLACVNISVLEVFLGLLGILVVLESNKSELPRFSTFPHDLDVCYLVLSVIREVLSHPFFSQVLRYVLDDQP